MLTRTGGKVGFVRIGSQTIAGVPLVGRMLGLTKVEDGSMEEAPWNPGLAVKVEEPFLMQTLLDVQGAVLDDCEKEARGGAWLVMLDKAGRLWARRCSAAAAGFRWRFSFSAAAAACLLAAALEADEERRDWAVVAIFKEEEEDERMAKRFLIYMAMATPRTLR